MTTNYNNQPVKLEPPYTPDYRGNVVISYPTPDGSIQFLSIPKSRLVAGERQP